MIDPAEELPTPLEICQIAFDSLLEVLGPEDLNEVLHASPLPVELDQAAVKVTAAFAPEYWLLFQQALFSRFGAAGAAGIVIRAGEVLFQNFHREYGMYTFFEQTSFLRLPKPERIRRGMEGLADLQQKYVAASQVIIDHDEENWYWKLQPLAEANGLEQNLLVKVMWGMLLGFLAWTGGGKKYVAHERNWEDVHTAERVIVIRKKYVD